MRSAFLTIAAAALTATAVHADELDQVVTQIEALPGVLQAFWSAGPQSN